MRKITRSSNETPAEHRYRRLFADRRRGESLTVLAARAGVATGTLAWWSHELRRRDRARAAKETVVPALLPVRVREVAPCVRARAAGYEIALADGRRVLRVPAEFEPEAVSALVAAVEGAQC